MNPDRPLPFLGGLTPRRFMREYWQKQPLFVPNALPGFSGTLDADELAGLACEELADSRIVLHDPEQHCWQLRRGPFDEQDFARLPAENWTLLVTDVDKWHADTEALLERIDFIPRWRVDDVMISYAAPGGSVGPHLDQYDVFLLQGPGRRRWQIGRALTSPPALLPNHELAILADFRPEQEWVAEAGDLLYLPPGVPHYGVALEACMTWSLGMRAPSLADMVTSHADHIAAGLPPDALLRDPQLEPCADPWQLSASQIRYIRDELQKLLQKSDSHAADWLGSWLTGHPAQWASPGAEEPIDQEELARQLAAGACLHRAPWSRVLWHENTFYIAGEAHTLPPGQARTLCHCNPVNHTQWQNLHPQSRQLLCALLAQGHYALGENA